MNSSENMSMKFYVYHHIIAISFSLNLSGPRQRDITTAALVEMGLEWKL